MKRSYRDLNELLYLRKREGNPLSKLELARLISEKLPEGRMLWPSKLTTLLNPSTYRVALDDDLVAAIADLLNQTPAYVRRYYEKAA